MLQGHMHMCMCACGGSRFLCSSALFTEGGSLIQLALLPSMLRGSLSLPAEAGIPCLPFPALTWVLGILLFVLQVL